MPLLKANPAAYQQLSIIFAYVPSVLQRGLSTEKTHYSLTFPSFSEFSFSHGDDTMKCVVERIYMKCKHQQSVKNSNSTIKHYGFKSEDFILYGCLQKNCGMIPLKVWIKFLDFFLYRKEFTEFVLFCFVLSAKFEIIKIGEPNNSTKNL